MVLVKINTPVHYHVKKYRICKNNICQGPGTLFDGNMVVSAGMAHMTNLLQKSIYLDVIRIILNFLRKDQLITMFILRVVFRALLDYRGRDMICWSVLASVVVVFFHTHILTRIYHSTSICKWHCVVVMVTYQCGGTSGWQYSMNLS